ncbi:protein kinase [Anabaena sp. FACHB-1237]|uniref:serine/threonine-protein kinase n=1 Tax=Anabaena sp. FACHB-1237 TaxID=2692769 RepID=UPI0016806619|nr:serine/threonine-protein kinase [Anabaena sp. FACHB-1237]MBD2136725.1 protein kinase [Anabaena sp. FACHB-1237]
MSLCINPNCQNPDNPNNRVNCATCRSELLLQGRYRVIKKLGSGGFGNTFEIEEARTNTPKVLKVLNNYDPKAIELFKQEADVLSKLSKLNHPGIPQVEPDAYFIYKPYQSNYPIYCIVMEKIEGINLQEYMEIRNYRPIDQTSAIEWLKDLINILDAVHGENFFHRDIKPPNIMLNNSSQLVLIDFGTVRKNTRTVVNQQGGVTQINSAGYTPPEQLNFNAVPQSDFYALGRTFVYLLTGKFPLDPDIYDNQNDQLNWRNHAPEISHKLADLLDDMMQRLYKDRPQNTQEILRRIAAIEANVKSTKTPNQPPNSTSQTLNKTTPVTDNSSPGSTMIMENNPITQDPSSSSDTNIIPENNNIQNQGLSKQLITGIPLTLAIITTIIAILIIAIFRAITITPRENLLTYENQQYGIKIIKYPESWNKTEPQNPLTKEFVSFIAPKQNPEDKFQEMLTIGVENFNGTLNEFADSNIKDIKNTISAAKILETSSTTLADGKAKKIVYIGKNGTDNLKNMQIVTLKGDRAYIVTYTAKTDDYEQFLQTVETMIKSLDIL